MTARLGISEVRCVRHGAFIGSPIGLDEKDGKGVISKAFESGKRPNWGGVIADPSTALGFGWQRCCQEENPTSQKRDVGHPEEFRFPIH